MSDLIKYPSDETYDLCVVLPTFNEKENIVILLDKIREVLKDENYQIIVVDDNSPDGTWEIAQHYARKYRNVQVIRRLNEKGLSSAILEGFGSSNSKWMVVMDADLQHDENILIHFISAFRKGTDIVVGSRKTAGGSIGEWNRFRRLVSWIATKMAFMILKNNVSDPMSGFFGIKKEVLERSIKNINPRGFKLLLEILVYNPGSKVSEIGYVFNKRLYGKSKLNTNVILDYLIALYELSLGKHIPLRFIKYSIVGVSGILVDKVVIAISMYIFHLSKYYGLGLGIELSIINNYFINNFWTFKEYQHKNTGIISGLITFHIVSLAGAIINYSTAILLSNQIGLNLYIANAFGIMLSTVWNWRINFQITWKKEI